MTSERLFEPTVIFFELTNFPTIFQMMMNKILQNSINTGKVRSFIKNMIVRAEEEERHNKVVIEVVKQLAENNLYIKPEKYKQKVREVGFLEVVIRLEGIKMEEKKVKGVLDQLTLKGVKDVQKFLGLANYSWQFIQDFTVIIRL